MIDWVGERAPVGERLRIVDLGAGNGNNQRHLAPLFPVPVEWVLVDSDRALLASAERTADLKPADTLVTEVTDLARADLAKLIAGAGLVTASALFDLVSKSWLDNLLDALAGEGSALLAVLTYDGRIEAGADHEALAAVRELMNAHQRTDKGFGPALGPDASAALSAGLAARAYEMRDGESDWIVGPDDPDAPELVRGWVEAASELVPEKARSFEAWAQTLFADPEAVIRVGHRDHFALPEVN